MPRRSTIKLRANRLPLPQLDVNVRPVPQRRLAHNRRDRAPVGALDVLRHARRGVERAVRPAELDDGEGVEDGPREPARAALCAERAWRASECVCGAWAVTFGMSDRPDCLAMGLEGRISTGWALVRGMARGAEDRRTPEMMTIQNSAETHPVIAYKIILGAERTQKTHEKKA